MNNHIFLELDYDLFSLDLISSPTIIQVPVGSTSHLLNYTSIRFVRLRVHKKNHNKHHF
jgi:hypothetical protein